MTFEDAVAIVIEIEGGYSSDPKDPGGETKYGISKRAYPNVDIKNLTKEQAAEIYRRDYWDKLKIDQMPEGLRLAVFDCAVNQGQHFAIMALQKQLGLAQDGICGVTTLSTLATYPLPRTILSDFLADRIHAYVRSPEWPRFGQGWSLRILEIALRSA